MFLVIRFISIFLISGKHEYWGTTRWW